jgi:hypothetical protein
MSDGLGLGGGESSFDVLAAAGLTRRFIFVSADLSSGMCIASVPNQ